MGLDATVCRLSRRSNMERSFNNDSPARSGGRVLGPVQRLDLGLIVDTEHDRVLGRVHIQPDHVGLLGDQLRIGRELERLSPPRPDPVVLPHLGHGAVIDTQPRPEPPRRPMRDPQTRRRRRQRRGDDPGPVHRPGPARTSLISQPGQAMIGIPGPPHVDRRPRHPDPLSDHIVRLRSESKPGRSRRTPRH